MGVQGVGSMEPVDPYSIPIEKIDISDPMLYHLQQFPEYFRRLRDEAPVHFCPESPFGPYWSITRFEDIVAIDINHKQFSSHRAVTLNEKRIDGGTEGATQTGGFLAMDPPDHDKQRKSVSPAVAPANIARLESMLRERAVALLSSLPIGEEFDWVEKVSVELTLMMLATLVDVPVEDRYTLKHWSDMATGAPGDGYVESWEHKDKSLKEMAAFFLKLRDERKNLPAKPDLISMIAHSAMSDDMSDADYVGNVALLIVGGNETTRTSMSGSIIAFDQFPSEWAKLMAKPELVMSTVSEILRFHTPLMVQGRRALVDYEIGGQTIKKGDKVMIWYASGNRDERVIEEPDSFIIDRERARHHLSFGFGIHRCLGNRLAEMQLRVLWEEIIKQNWKRIEVVAPPTYSISHSINGVEHLPVVIHA